MSDVTTDTVHRQVQANMLVKRTDNFGTAGKIILTGPFFGHAVFIVWMIVVSFQTLRIEGLLNAFFCKQIFIANTIFIVTYYIVSLYTAYLFGFIPDIIGVLLYICITRWLRIRAFIVRVVLAMIIGLASTTALATFYLVYVMDTAIWDFPALGVMSCGVFAASATVLLFDRHYAG